MYALSEYIQLVYVCVRALFVRYVKQGSKYVSTDTDKCKLTLHEIRRNCTPWFTGES